MTNAEYNLLYIEARKNTAKLSIKAQIGVKLAYQKATHNVAKVLNDAIERNLSIITIQSNYQLINELQIASTNLAKEIENITTDAVEKSSAIYTTPSEKYLLSAFSDASVSTVDKNFVKDTFSKINNNAVRNMVARTYSDGYTFSNRVWNLKGNYEKTIKDIISAGMAQGRDPVKIIKDIQIYVKDGKIALSERWGALERGTREWYGRIDGNIDWRAQRLVRSEIQATVQSVSVLSGEANPASTGEYDWILGPGLVHCSKCEDLAYYTYTAENIPPYPHSNCGCQVRPKLRDHDQFMDDLVAWNQGIVTEGNRYIEDWYQLHRVA